MGTSHEERGVSHRLKAPIKKFSASWTNSPMNFALPDDKA
jgi:hypothetical protein